MAERGPAGTVALFGGSFNPPHVAHLAVAAAAAAAGRVDRLLWVPAATSPFKVGDPAPTPTQRLEMVRLAVKDDPIFRVWDFEVAQGGVSYTVDTLRALLAESPHVEPVLVIGGDSLAGFTGWREPEEILRMARLLVYRRPGFDEAGVPAEVLERATFVDAPRIELSSSEIRRRLAAGLTVKYLVPEAVLAYISAERLYRAWD